MRWLVVVLFCLTFASAAQADMQCGLGLVEVGDSQERVLEKCGPPTNQARADLSRVEPVQTADGEVVNEAVDVPRVEWIYNFGPTRFVKRVVFIDGKVSTIEEGGYPE